MLDFDVAERQLLEAERLLGTWTELAAVGPASAALAQHVRELQDLLTCLLDESLEREHPKLHYLIDRCETLAGRLAN